MGYTQLATLKRQEEENKQKNAQLKALIFKNKKNKGLLEDIQLVRFGNDLVVAIKRPREQEGALGGGFGKIYTAHPVTSSGEIKMDVKLTVKIIKDTERTLTESGVEEVTLKAAYIQDDEDHKEKRTIPAVTVESHAARNKAAVSETIADQKIISARTTRIPTPEKVDGETVYETAIIMSTVQGVSLDKFNFFNLTKEKRLRLAINVIKAYEALHSKGVFHRDIKLNNIMVNPETLEVTPIDLDNSVSTEFIRAPEDNGGANYRPTIESEIYSLAQDILPSILSGYRYMTIGNHDPETIGDNFANAINTKFSPSGILNTENNTSRAIKARLNKMRSKKPADRGTLQEARADLEAQLEALEKASSSQSIARPKASSPESIAQPKASLRQLDEVLQSSEYRIKDEYIMSDIDSAYELTVTETIFRLEELAADIISAFTKKIDESGNDIVPEIPKDKISEYNHHQRQLAVLMKKETYPALAITEQAIDVLAFNTKTKAPEPNPAKNTETASIYILAETLQHIRKAVEPQKDNDRVKPARTKSYSGNELAPQEKCSVMNDFKKGFDDFFRDIKSKFSSEIQRIFKSIDKILTDAPQNVGKNQSGFFHHPDGNGGDATKPENGHRMEKKVIRR